LRYRAACDGEPTSDNNEKVWKWTKFYFTQHHVRSIMLDSGFAPQLVFILSATHNSQKVKVKVQ